MLFILAANELSIPSSIALGRILAKRTQFIMVLTMTGTISNDWVRGRVRRTLATLSMPGY